MNPPRRRSTVFLVLAASCHALVVSCASLTPPLPNEADAVHAATEWPGASLATLEQGRALYMSRCSGCHQPFDPATFAAGDWPPKVSEMRDRARLSPEEESLIVRYLMTIASRSHAKVMARQGRETQALQL